MMYTCGMTCSFEGCGRDVRSKGLCTGHYAQQSRGRQLTPLRPTGARMVRDEQGRKHCGRCTTWKPVHEFGRNKAQADGLNGYCASCHRFVGLLNRYGLTPEQHAQMLAAQGGGCAICGSASAGVRSLHVDHDHACCPESGRSCGKCVRGLLCDSCNLAIGKMNDDAARLRRAADYLDGGRS